MMLLFESVAVGQTPQLMCVDGLLFHIEGRPFFQTSVHRHNTGVHRHNIHMGTYNFETNTITLFTVRIFLSH